jgi:predicted DNA-binding transcriptional regulator AlpA
MPKLNPNKPPVEIPAYLADERVVSIQVAAEVADLSEWTMYDLVKRGRGPPIVRYSGRRIGVRVKDLKAWIASQLTQPEQVAS